VANDGHKLVIDCGFTALTQQGFYELDGSFALVEVYIYIRYYIFYMTNLLKAKLNF